MSYKGRFSIFVLILLILGQSSFAESISIKGNKGALKIENNGPGEQFSSAFVAGDFNGDGAMDLAISAPYASSDLKEWNGRVSIFFGGSDYSKESSINIYGSNSGDLTGIFLSAGDLNNDGIDDLVISSHNALKDDSRIGKVSILWGQEYFEDDSINLAEYSGVSEIFGQEKESNFGITTMVYDVNDDLLLDLLIGAPNASNDNNDEMGKVYFYLDQPGKKQSPDFSLSGFSKNGKFGSLILAGDINDDNKTEIFISAYREDFENIKEAGGVYVYQMNDLYKNVWDKTAHITAVGKKDYDWFGFQGDTGDLDNDGVMDIAISSFPFASKQREGKVFVFTGREDFLEGVDESSVVSFEYPLRNNILGASIFIENVLNNGKNQIIAGAPGIGYPKSEESGVVHIFELGESYKLINGENPDDWFGYRVFSMDFNSDGFNDLIIGAKYADGINGVDNGAVYVLWGSESSFPGDKNDYLDIGEGSNTITRGEMIALTIQHFNLKEKKASYIDNCMAYKDFCFFEFTTRSKFADLKLEPELILYPDNLPGSKYYEEINIATMIGIVNGHSDSENSPFLPEGKISRIHALKVVLGASELLDFKYKFELEGLLGSFDAIFKQSSYYKDINAAISYMWWYPRYVNFAYENGLVDMSENFRPDDFITLSELMDMINKTKEHITKLNAGTQTES